MRWASRSLPLASKYAVYVAAEMFTVNSDEIVASIAPLFPARNIGEYNTTVYSNMIFDPVALSIGECSNEISGILLPERVSHAVLALISGTVRRLTPVCVNEVDVCAKEVKATKEGGY